MSLWSETISQMGTVTLIFPMQRADNCQIIIKTTFMRWLLRVAPPSHTDPCWNSTSKHLNPSSVAVILKNNIPDFHWVWRLEFPGTLCRASPRRDPNTKPAAVPWLDLQTPLGLISYKNLCGRCAWLRINMNNSMCRSTFQKGPALFLRCCRKTHTSEAAEVHGLLHFIPCWWVKAAGWKHDSPICSAVYPAEQWSEDYDTLRGNGLVCACRNRAVIWGITPGISVEAPRVLEAGSEGRGAVWHCRVRKRSCGDVKCPVCHQIPPLLAKLLPLWLLNMHRDLLIHREKMQS